MAANALLSYQISITYSPLIDGQWPVVSHLFVYLPHLYLTTKTLYRLRIPLFFHAVYCLCVFLLDVSLDTRLLCYFLRHPPPILHLLYLTLFGQRSTQRPCFDPVHRPSHRRKIGRAIFESWEPIRRSDCGATPDSKRGECNHEGRLDFRFWKRCTYICDAENADVTVMVQCMLVYISGQ